MPQSKRRQAEAHLEDTHIVHSETCTPANPPDPLTAPEAGMNSAMVSDIVELVYRRLQAERPAYEEASHRPLPSYYTSSESVIRTSVHRRSK